MLLKLMKILCIILLFLCCIALAVYVLSRPSLIHQYSNKITDLKYHLYPLHKQITATVFWVGEPIGNGSSEDNSESVYDPKWLEHYGGIDDPYQRKGYFPVSFIPKQNPFYLDVPYNDFYSCYLTEHCNPNQEGKRKPDSYLHVYWAHEKRWVDGESMMKNRWVKLIHRNKVCYGQNEDAGPYQYNDYEYVFGTALPKNKLANNAGMDVSPALRDCLGFSGLNNDENSVDWQWIDERNVPEGPWRE
ncbi:MAG: hypothetical protein EPO02_14035, partial [Nitrospirae bacterium]